MTSTMDRPTRPGEAWAALLEGNERFVRGEMVHPSQDAAHRAALSSSQAPFAVVFGCSDSRVAAEIVFDQGLGDAFVVRTAGHVIDTTVLGSIEFGVEVLGTPLVVVLAHDKCGAVAAAAKTLASGEQAPGFVRAVVDRVIPSIVGLTSTGKPLDSFDAAELGHEHVRQTARMLNDYSAVLSRRTADGSCAIVAVEYTLEDGRAKLVETVGRLD
ncbi:MAG: carbonic anhydrase [Cellulomonas sp. 14-74-6]|nr:MAG: carbonic anhydrase [Cellulomonas sp. 14-74-6]